MTYTELIELINQEIVTNGNREITANVLNPILRSMTDWSLSQDGVLDTLNTTDKSNLVAAINEVNQALATVDINSSQVYSGLDNPNTTPPPSYGTADFYIQLDSFNDVVAVFLYDGNIWINLTQALQNALTPSFLALTDTPDTYSGQATKKVVVKADESGLEFIEDTVSTPTLQQVTEAGEEILSDDGLKKIVVNRNSGRIEIYQRADVGDAFVQTAIFDKNIFQIQSLDGSKYANVEAYGFSVVNPNAFDVTRYLYDRVINYLDDFTNPEFLLPTFSEGGKFSINAIPKTTSFTAEFDVPYTANGTLTVTDPTPLASKGYVVHVIGGTATIGGVGYTAGALVYRYYDGSVWVSKDYGASITIDSTPTDGSANAVSSNGVFDALALKQDKVTGVSDTEIGYLDGVTSAIQTQLDARVKANRFVFQTTASITGVTGEQVITSFKIPAGAYSSNDGFTFQMSMDKSVTASTITYKVYVGTTANALTQQVAQSVITGANRRGDVVRYYVVNGGNLNTSVNFMSSSQSGLSGFGLPNSDYPVTMSNDLWWTITANPTVTTETVGVLFSSITPLK